MIAQARRKRVEASRQCSRLETASTSGYRSSRLTRKAASELLQAVHPDRYVEDPVAIQSALYVDLRMKASVALPLPCVKAYSSGEQDTYTNKSRDHSLIEIQLV